MFDTGFTFNDFLYMLGGAGVTLELTGWAMLLGTIGGIAAGLCATMCCARALLACIAGRVPQACRC